MTLQLKAHLRISEVARDIRNAKAVLLHYLNQIGTSQLRFDSQKRPQKEGVGRISTGPESK